MSALVKIGAVLGIGLLLCGTVNYRRNAHLETDIQQDRPYATLSDAELAALTGAYEQEREALEHSLAKLEAAADSGERYAPGDVQGKVNGFEKAQRQATRWNEVNGARLDQQVEIDRLERERKLRASGVLDRSMFWRRLLTL